MELQSIKKVRIHGAERHGQLRQSLALYVHLKFGTRACWPVFYLIPSVSPLWLHTTELLEENMWGCSCVGGMWLSTWKDSAVPTNARGCTQRRQTNANNQAILINSNLCSNCCELPLLQSNVFARARLPLASLVCRWLAHNACKT
eukprot:6216179-Amphidinium_carterae.2